MASYKTEQRYIRYEGVEYHFVSYDRTAATKSQPATAAYWYLISSGKRWAVMEQVAGQSPEEIDARLTSWLAQCDFTQSSTASLR